MTYVFRGSASELMAACLDDLHRAAAGGPARDSYFERALMSLVGLHERCAQAGAPAPSDLVEFRRASASAFLQFPDLLSLYSGQCLDLAESAREEDWYELCMRRSALQCLLDDYADSAIPALMDDEALAELDEEMRRVGQEHGPLALARVPAGMPNQHWWWSFPATADQPAPGAPAVRILDPALSYAALQQRLAGAGWLAVDVSAQPLVPGEPEYATFERKPGERLVYSFNPVCRLRLLEAMQPLDDASAALVPTVAEVQIMDWLRAADERSILRGLLAARQAPSTALRQRVEILCRHSHPTLARAASDSLAAMNGVSDLPRQTALGIIEALRQQLLPLLKALGQDGDGRLVASLKPRPGDFALAFVAKQAPAAHQAYDSYWAQAPRLPRFRPDSRVDLYLAPAGMLTEDNELSRHFPGGYRSIAPQLNPQRIWAAWKVIEPGQSAGSAYDGLVWLDDHWAWLPKPYRVLAQR